MMESVVSGSEWLPMWYNGLKTACNGLKSACNGLKTAYNGLQMAYNGLSASRVVRGCVWDRPHGRSCKNGFLRGRVRTASNSTLRHRYNGLKNAYNGLKTACNG